jgi:methionine synthase II (cobalamin-independent)
LEQKVTGTYENIPQAAQREDITIEKKIDQIAQAIDQYQKETKNNQ